ncbi:MAG: DUF4214 domain-containing protein, partial [Candidatus Cryosericum sp.]
NRAQDPGGEAYWAGRLQAGMSLNDIAQSYSVQPESTNLYPFLANPNTASYSAVKAFVDAVYANLFDRAPDGGGESYWIMVLQNGQSTVGDTILNIISGAQGNDVPTINNKVTVADYYETQIVSHNVAFSQSFAQTVLSGVTYNVSTVGTAEASILASL